jgi:hypothetical protein
MEKHRVIIVDKKNFHLSLFEFRQLLEDSKLKYVFLNCEFSNLDGIIQKYTSEDIVRDNFSYTWDILEENKTQIIFSEFLFFRESEGNYKLVTFLIPSLKFHKFMREEYIRLQPECMMFLNSTGLYDFKKVINIDSLSYMNLNCEIKENFEKILKEGKPTKKENKKSYNFYPKNVLNPTKLVKEEMVNLAGKIYEFIIENSVVNTLCMPVQNNFYVVERIINFDWKSLVSPYDKTMINTRIKSCLLEKKDNTDTSQILCYLKCLNSFFNQNDFTQNLVFQYINEIVLNNWKIFIEAFLNYGILIIAESHNTWSFIIRQLSKDISLELIHFIDSLITLMEKGILLVEDIYKNDKFSLLDISQLLPKYFSYKYELEVILDREQLNKRYYIKDFKKDYDYLYMNKNNEKKIIFNYEIEKSTTKLIEDINKHISEKQKTFSIRIIDDGFFREIRNFVETDKKKQFLAVFNGCFDIQTDSVISKDKTNNISYIKNYLKFKLVCDYSEEEVREKFIEFFRQQKREFILNEEMGIALFYKILFDSGVVLASANIYTKLMIIYKEIFSKSKDFEEFNYFIFNKTKTVEANLLITRGTFMKEFMKHPNDYITHRLFKITPMNKINYNTYLLNISGKEMLYSNKTLSEIQKEKIIILPKSDLDQINTNYKVIIYNIDNKHKQ